MWTVFHAAFDICYYAVTDFLLFMVVDFIAKAVLRETNNEAERRKVWLLEFIALLAVSVVIYVLSHRPYLLYVLSLVTLLYTQAYGRVDFRYWWTELTTRWDDCQQHEESMEHLRQQMSVTPAMAMTQAYPVVSMLPRQPYMPDMASQEREPVIGYNYTPSTANRFPYSNIRSPTDGVQFNSVQDRAMYMSHIPQDRQQPRTSRPMQTAATRGAPVMRNHSPLSSPKVSLTPKKTNSLAAGTRNNNALASKMSLKSRVFNAFGLTRSQDRPPGLRNNGQNICFINSVLQCLSRCPVLVKRLSDVKPRMLRATTDEVALCENLTDILHLLKEDTQVDVADSKALRLAASKLNDNLVAPPGLGPQSQQDAAEFLTWLLETLHTILMKDSLAGNGIISRNPVNEQNEDQYTSPALSTLKFIYGDLTHSKIETLKNACRREIEIAHGLDTDSYAEPIQRLSDLEWLTYKQNNRSLVDDLFTGQCIDAQHCLDCNRISISIQTFNVLPVPIVQPRQVNGLVYLEDCFSKFGHIENLFGQDGLKCSNCNQTKSVIAKLGTAPSSVKQRLIHSTPAGNGNRLASDSAYMSPIREVISGMSPIQGDITSDSGFHDNHLRTSTPMQMTSPPSNNGQLLTDGQRRSMLRQLPEIMVIQLMRFDCVGSYTRKVTLPVSVPLHNLDMTNLVFDTLAKREDLTATENSYRYSLCGLCAHLGANSTSSGHYISYSVTSDGDWYKFDDDLVTKINIDYELTLSDVRQNVYLLFYKRHNLDVV